MSTQSTCKYRAPLVYVDPIAKLEAADTPLLKNPLALKQGILFGLLEYHE